MEEWTRRDLLIRAAALTGASGIGLGGLEMDDEGRVNPGVRPTRPKDVEVLNPRGRVPVSLIIDDSTCLVNLAHFCIPQFAEVFPDRYRQPWRTLPREIPDAFVRKFGEWAAAEGVKGKYSVIPYPACVGWLDREIPGWTRKELRQSLDLLREVMAPNWDFHTEMVSHTRIIDTKTGRAFEEYTERFMENWEWTRGRSVDEIADYIAYALRILKNAGIRCEGITTPGGFGNNARPQLAQATLQACRDVFKAEIPHYFRHLFTGKESVAPRVEYASGLDGTDPKCVVSIIGCTGDWFGGWDGMERGNVDLLITADGKGGRVPEVISRGEPAIMVCHWPGIYFNGEEVGFRILKAAVARIRTHFRDAIWMKQSEIARYWAAKELTRIERDARGLSLRAPYACPRFTLRTPAPPESRPQVRIKGLATPLRSVSSMRDLDSGRWIREGGSIVACLDLPRGSSRLEF